MPSHVVIAVSDPSTVGEARRVATRLGEQAGLNETDRGRAAIVASELATNLVRHARGGQLLLSAMSGPAAPGVEIISTDSGPGMTDVERCLRDGFSTGGTPGNGLGAVRRLSAEFDV